MSRDTPEQQVERLKLGLEAVGYTSSVAEALAENNISATAAQNMTPEQVHDIWCDWEGLINCGPSVRDAWDNAKVVRLEQALAKAEAARGRMIDANSEGQTA